MNENNGKQHVLLVNLGSPRRPEKRAVKAYLYRFLTDSHVIKHNGFLWKLLLNTVVLPLRSKEVAKKYREIWLDEGAPLVVYTRRLTEKLAARQPHRTFDYAMVYDRPFITEALDKRRWKEDDDLLIVAMYPQYSHTTFRPIQDQVRDYFSQRPHLVSPRIQYVQDYSEHPFYIKALADSVKSFWRHFGRGEKLIMSFHGLPQEYIEAGDPYASRCQATAQALAQALNLNDEQWQLSWQSQFGPKQWLEPKTDAVLTDLARNGVRHADVICPGFSTDGLETLEEIDQQYRGVFMQAGGEQMGYIPALNDSSEQVLLYEQLLAERLNER